MSTTLEQRGLWFDELEEDVLYKHTPGRTVEAHDNTLFSTLTMNPQALHLDAHFSAQQEFGQRLINSMMTMSILVGQSVSHLTQGTLVANLGFSEVSFPEPVFAGDTLYGETTVVGKRLSQSQGWMPKRTLTPRSRSLRVSSATLYWAWATAMP
jgi:acyl dehydratase